MQMAARGIASPVPGTRMVTTLETAASTIAPSTPALHVPITSSITNSTAEIGALNAAASPAAVPTGAIKRSFSCESRRLRPISDAIPAPISSEGSSGPSDCPLPMASAHTKNFPIYRGERQVAVGSVHGGFDLIYSAAAHACEHINPQQSDCNTRNGRSQPQTRGNDGDNDGPSSVICVHSIASLKHTTTRPKKCRSAQQAIGRICLRTT